MDCKTKAIVFSKIKYRDSDLIVSCFTDAFGLESFILRGVLKRKRGFTKVAYFQQLSQLQLNYNKIENRDLYTLKAVKTSYLYRNVYTHILKSTVALFLAEVLTYSVREKMPNPDLFKYLETSLQWFDLNETNPNFHLLFLLNLSKYLGFYPNTTNLEALYFNLYSGEFQDFKTQYTIESENLTLLKTLLGTTFEALSEIKINGKQRQQFLVLLLKYFELHLESFKTPKALQVLNDVFDS